MATVFEQPTQAQQKVILHGVTWDTYERLLAEHQDSSSTRFAYDRGTLEIMILSLRHERLKHSLATLVEIFAEEMQIDIEGAGSTTLRREVLSADLNRMRVFTSSTPNAYGRKMKSI